MKVAIVHDYIKEYGGAERVLEELIKLYPKATVYTTVYLPKYLGPHRKRFKEYKIRTSFLQWLPFKAKLISPFRLLSPLAFKFFNFTGFDLIIVSQTGAYFPNIVDKEKATLISYTHTPPRYLYGFATAREWKKNIVLRVLGEVANHFLRLLDFRAAQNVDYFIANSQNVAARIKKFYRRDAVVIYPPVLAQGQPRVADDAHLINSRNGSNTRSLSERLFSSLSVNPDGDLTAFSSSASGLSPRSYYLAGGRLARPKHIELIVITFTKLRLPLKVFGKEFAGYGASLRRLAGKNVEFVGEISDEEKLEIMQNAKAYVFAAEDEDFGITPVEAMMVGIPVIAYKSGGVTETVEDPSAGSGQVASGVFFDRLSALSLTEAINKFKKLDFDKDAIIKHGQKFSTDNFDRQFRQFVSKVVKK